MTLQLKLDIRELGKEGKVVRQDVKAALVELTILTRCLRNFCLNLSIPPPPGALPFNGVSIPVAGGLIPAREMPGFVCSVGDLQRNPQRQQLVAGNDRGAEFFHLPVRHLFHRGWSLRLRAARGGRHRLDQVLHVRPFARGH